MQTFIETFNKTLRNNQLDIHSHDETQVVIHRHKLKLTHLQKIYWPEEGYTKGDLIAYYRDIASFILPYLKDRPEVLHRHPDGIRGFHFHQKNMTGLPPWIKSKNFHAETHTKRSII